MDFYKFIDQFGLIFIIYYILGIIVGVYHDHRLTFTTSPFLIFIPYITLFINALFIPIGPSPHKPVFQPPDWVFGVAWTIISLSFGLCAYTYLSRYIDYKYLRSTTIQFYRLLFFINMWPLVNSNGWYEAGFYLLLITSFLSIKFTLNLLINSHPTANHNYIFLMLPLMYWLILATSLNGVIWDYVASKYFFNHLL
jgi:tryptophan-rich sensory protein